MPLACFIVAKKAAGTPATVLLTARQVPHELHPYDVSPDAPSDRPAATLDRTKDLPNYGAVVAAACRCRSRRPI